MYCGEYLCAVWKPLCCRNSVCHGQSPCPVTRVRVLWGVFVCRKERLCPVESLCRENMHAPGRICVLRGECVRSTETARQGKCLCHMGTVCNVAVVHVPWVESL